MNEFNFALPSCACLLFIKVTLGSVIHCIIVYALFDKLCLSWWSGYGFTTQFLNSTEDSPLVLVLRDPRVASS